MCSGVIAAQPRGRADVRAGATAASAPAPHRRSMAAQCSAVMPSPCAALTSAPCLQQRPHRGRIARLGGISDIGAGSMRNRQRRRLPPQLTMKAAAIRASLHDWTTFRSIALGAVAELVDVDADALQRGQHGVGHRRAVVRLQVAIALQRAAGLAGEEQRAALVVVQVRIAHRRAVDDQRVVEHVAVAVRNLLQLVEQVRHQADVIGVDLLEVGDAILAIEVMRSGVERRCRCRSSRKTRFDTSRLNLNEKMRVVSAANATACRSNISLTCSSNESGTPIGAPGSSRGSPVWFDCSTFWMRRSISRTSSR